MNKKTFKLDNDLDNIRKNFPILSRGIYLISNSLGAVPIRAREYLLDYYQTWEQEGVGAWRSKWWDLARNLGNRLAFFLGGKEDEITILPNATTSHWVAFSTLFNNKNLSRNKIIMTELEFPSIINAALKIADFMNWQVKIIPCQGKPGVDVDELMESVDDKTLLIATSHVYFKSGYIQNISAIAARAREKGAFSLIDGYHAPGVIPVELNKTGVDFYVGGCLKWLCGGPGNAFLYVRPELANTLEPQLTGWFAHQSPFSFSHQMEYSQGAYRFMSGTPPIPALYTALAGLEEIESVGISQIREKSLKMTGNIIDWSKDNKFALFSPEKENVRGGAVSIQIPHGYQVKQALDKRGIQVDFRKGTREEPDVLRVGPHFYNQTDEISEFFQAVEEILATKEYRKYPDKIGSVT